MHLDMCLSGHADPQSISTVRRESNSNPSWLLPWETLLGNPVNAAKGKKYHKHSFSLSTSLTMLFYLGQFCALQKIIFFQGPLQLSMAMWLNSDKWYISLRVAWDFWDGLWVDSVRRNILCLSLVPISSHVDIMVGTLSTILYQEVILQLQGTRTRRN